MEDRETPRMRKYGESKTTRIMMATVPHVTSGSGLRKFQADGFLFDRVYLWYTSLNLPFKFIIYEKSSNSTHALCIARHEIKASNPHVYHPSHRITVSSDYHTVNKFSCSKRRNSKQHALTCLNISWVLHEMAVYPSISLPREYFLFFLS